MKMESHTADRVLSILVKEPFKIHTATSLAKSLNITRQGIWKTLNKLSEGSLIKLEPVGDAKTSAVTIKLNWLNPLTEKTLSLLLTKESLKHQRWRVNFEELEKAAKFLMLFGSVLNNPKGANDTDIMAVVNKKNFKAVEEIVAKVQQTQLKKIHMVDLTEAEFIQELKKPNMAYIDAVKRGIVLYGQDTFIKFMRNLKNEG